MAALLSDNYLPHQSVVQLNGTAGRLSGEVFRQQFAPCGSFQQIILRCQQFARAQHAQNILCHAFHTVAERLCTWLLGQGVKAMKHYKPDPVKDKWRALEHQRLPIGCPRCRRKFLRFFPKGFQDEKYVAWERGYKWRAHEQWAEMLNRAAFQSLIKQEKFAEIAARAVRIESKTNLLFSFEKMALRDAVKSDEGARSFATGLYDFLYGKDKVEQKFGRWVETVAALPRRQTRVLTWPLVTIFGFIALPETHIFLKPTVTRVAAREFGFDFQYKSQPSWDIYANLLSFAAAVRQDLHDMPPRDMIDIQSYMWVQGSDEYEE
ncbi:MAG: hypothetical protein JO316_20385 [Abitibacteriaceae bacterium]|nr:hypothetical protein [Abditibacteriaceae bacterium]MBV9867716.1 hypothetical protein [Abditibacteriaceae bacterium]